jgi:uncharacterized integral membrane protein
MGKHTEQGVEFLQRILQHEDIAFVQTERCFQYSTKVQQKGEYHVFIVRLLKAYVLIAFAMHDQLNVGLGFIAGARQVAIIV